LVGGALKSVEGVDPEVVHGLLVVEVASMAFMKGRGNGGVR
jgi:hypothetical protein